MVSRPYMIAGLTIVYTSNFVFILLLQINTNMSPTIQACFSGALSISLDSSLYQLELLHLYYLYSFQLYFCTCLTLVYPAVLLL